MHILLLIDIGYVLHSHVYAFVNIIIYQLPSRSCAPNKQSFCIMIRFCVPTCTQIYKFKISLLLSEKPDSVRVCMTEADGPGRRSLFSRSPLKCF